MLESVLLFLVACAFATGFVTAMVHLGPIEIEE